MRRSVTPRGRGFPATQLCPAAPCGSRERSSLVIPRERSSLVARGTDGPAHSRKAQSAFRTTWARPGFLLPFHGGGGGSEQCCDPRLPDPSRGLSRRFNSRWSRALSPNGERELNPFAVVGPERWNGQYSNRMARVIGTESLCNEPQHLESPRPAPVARLAALLGRGAPCGACVTGRAKLSRVRGAWRRERRASRTRPRPFSPPGYRPSGRLSLVD